MKSFARRIIPASLLSLYHFFLAWIGSVRYGDPSKELVIIGVTGTKGKTTTAQLLSNILEAAGKKTALLGTLKFKIGDKEERNLLKMTMPGRFFVQKFLHDAVNAGCTHAIIEMTSEGARQHRHRFIAMDSLIFTNLSPEHIESHGSYEAYRDAKLSIAWALVRSPKPRHVMVANADDPAGNLFLSIPRIRAVPYRLADGAPVEAAENGCTLTFRGVEFHSPLPGTFNAMNIIAAATAAAELGIAPNVIAAGIARTEKVEGRMEKIDAGQSFPVIVDYAHTPDSLEAVYKTFPTHRKICVLGNTGGGRDKWKRPVMGKIAGDYCAEIILTNEDPYDEDPAAILEDMRKGISRLSPEVILDRRQAIARAVALAQQTPNTVVLITGKGTDPFIMGPNGTKEPWDDRGVAREELQKIVGSV